MTWIAFVVFACAIYGDAPVVRCLLGAIAAFALYLAAFLFVAPRWELFSSPGNDELPAVFMRAFLAVAAGSSVGFLPAAAVQAVRSIF